MMRTYYWLQIKVRNFLFFPGSLLFSNQLHHPHADCVSLMIIVVIIIIIIIISIIIHMLLKLRHSDCIHHLTSSLRSSALSSTHHHHQHYHYHNVQLTWIPSDWGMKATNHHRCHSRCNHHHHCQHRYYHHHQHVILTGIPSDWGRYATNISVKASQSHICWGSAWTSSSSCHATIMIANMRMGWQWWWYWCSPWKPRNLFAAVLSSN